MATADTLTDEELTADVAAFERKLKRLTKAGPGAGMAAAVASVHLRELQGEARSRGLEL